MFLQLVAAEAAVVAEVLELHLLGGEFDQDAVQCVVVLDVFLALLPRHLVERRLGDVDVAGLDQLRHLPAEKREQQGADVAAIHIGIGHDDDLVVAGACRG